MGHDAFDQRPGLARPGPGLDEQRLAQVVADAFAGDGVDVEVLGPGRIVVQRPRALGRLLGRVGRFGGLAGGAAPAALAVAERAGNSGVTVASVSPSGRVGVGAVSRAGTLGGEQRELAQGAVAVVGWGHRGPPEGVRAVPGAGVPAMAPETGDSSGAGERSSGPRRGSARSA